MEGCLGFGNWRLVLGHGWGWHWSVVGCKGFGCKGVGNLGDRKSRPDLDARPKGRRIFRDAEIYNKA